MDDNRRWSIAYRLSYSGRLSTAMHERRTGRFLITDLFKENTG
jgi:hypothetical protein